MSDKTETVELVCVGDVFPRNRTTLDPTRSILTEADITFGQLEYVLSRKGTKQVFAEPPELNRRPGSPPPAASFWPPADPEEQLKIAVEAGFNVMSLASNNTYLWSDEGVIETVEALKRGNIACVGAGKDITEATKPAVLEKKGQKIGFLAYCSVVPPGGWATHNKAGVAPIRSSTAYEQIDWQPGSPPRTISWCNQDDIAGMAEDIKILKSRVDVVVVSMHWGVTLIPGLIADYQFEAAHSAVDAGADLIIGHHSHILRGIEVYKGKTIFYSVGNFCCPPGKKISPVRDSGIDWMENRVGYRFQIDPSRPYFPYPIDAQKTMIVKCEIFGNNLQRVAYLPLWMNSQNQPEVVNTDIRFEDHLQYMRWLCGSQGIDTKFIREGNEVVIQS